MRRVKRLIDLLERDKEMIHPVAFQVSLPLFQTLFMCSLPDEHIGWIQRVQNAPSGVPGILKHEYLGWKSDFVDSFCRINTSQYNGYCKCSKLVLVAEILRKKIWQNYQNESLGQGENVFLCKPGLRWLNTL